MQLGSQEVFIALQVENKNLATAHLFTEEVALHLAQAPRLIIDSTVAIAAAAAGKLPGGGFKPRQPLAGGK